MCLNISIVHILHKGNIFWFKHEILQSNFHLISFKKNDCPTHYDNVTKHHNYNMLCITSHATSLHIWCIINFHKFLCIEVEAKMSASTQNKQIRLVHCINFSCDTTAFVKLFIKFEAMIAKKYSKMHSTEANYFRRHVNF